MSSSKFFLDDDMYWHLATGRYIVENKSIPSQDVFGFITQGQKWIPFEWGWDILIYGIHNLGGDIAVSFFRSILCVLIFFFVFKIAQNFKINPLYTLAISLFILVASLSRLSPRPHLISYLFLVILLYLLMDYRYLKRINIKKLYILPVFFLVWVNLHIEVLIGIFILIFFVISEYREKKKIPKNFNAGDFKKLIFITALSVAALLCVPHFIDTYFYIYAHTQMEMLNHINEWKSPFDKTQYTNVYTILYFIFLTVAIICTTIYYRKSKDIFAIIVLLGMIVVSFRAVRYKFDFMLVMFIFVLIPLNSIKLKAFTQKISEWGMVVLIAVLIYTSFTNIFYKNVLSADFRETGMSVNHRFFPMEAINFISAQKLSINEIRFYNSLRIGGLLLWSFPGYKNFIDSRDLNDEIYSRYKSIETMRPGFEKEISKMGLNGFIFSMPYAAQNAAELNKTIIGYLSKNSLNWKLIFWDDKSLIFVKNDSEFSNIIRDYEYKYLSPYNIVMAPEILVNAFRNDKERFRKEFTRKLVEEPQGIFINRIKQKFNF